MSAVLKMSGVSKSFGQAEIIRDIDFEIENGERHAVIMRPKVLPSASIKIHF